MWSASFWGEVFSSRRLFILVLVSNQGTGGVAPSGRCSGAEPPKMVALAHWILMLAYFEMPCIIVFYFCLMKWQHTQIGKKIRILYGTPRGRGGWWWAEHPHHGHNYDYCDATRFLFNIVSLPNVKCCVCLRFKYYWRKFHARRENLFLADRSFKCGSNFSNKFKKDSLVQSPSKPCDGSASSI